MTALMSCSLCYLNSLWGLLNFFFLSMPDREAGGDVDRDGGYGLGQVSLHQCYGSGSISNFMPKSWFLSWLRLLSLNWDETMIPIPFITWAIIRISFITGAIIWIPFTRSHNLDIYHDWTYISDPYHNWSLNSDPYSWKWSWFGLIIRVGAMFWIHIIVGAMIRINIMVGAIIWMPAYSWSHNSDP